MHRYNTERSKMPKEFKIAQISDCHLGYRSGQFRDVETGINLREQDGYDALEKAIDEIVEAKPDVVICSGYEPESQTLPYASKRSGEFLWVQQCFSWQTR